MSYRKRPTVTPAGIHTGGIVSFCILAGTLVLSRLHGWNGPVCPIWFVYHIHCPGCGLTRSFIEIWHGQLWLSIRYHPFGLPLFLICVLVVVAAILDWRLAKTRPVVRSMFNQMLSARSLSPVAGLLVLLWLARLLLEYRHTALFLW